jgi:hypothetical protein
MKTNLFRRSLLALAAGVLFAQMASAQSNSVMALELAPAQSQRSSTATGVFYESTHEVVIGAGVVMLASTSDGLGALRTDDAMTLTVRHPDGAVRVFAHDFRDRAGAIRPLPPQDVSALFVPGLNRVTLTLRDVRRPMRSSSAYVLVFAAPAPAATSTDTTLPTATALPTPIPATALPTLRPMPTALPTMPPAPTPLPTTVATSSDASSNIEPVWLIAGIAVLMAIVLAALLLRRRPASNRPRLSGVIHLSDTDSGERLLNVDLTNYGERAAIQIAPLQVVKAKAATRPAAWLTATTTGMCVLEQNGEAPMSLADQTEAWIADHVSLEYRSSMPQREAWPVTPIPSGDGMAT